MKCNESELASVVQFRRKKLKFQWFLKVVIYCNLLLDISKRRIKILSLLQHTGISTRDLNTITNVASCDTETSDKHVELQNYLEYKSWISELLVCLSELGASELNALYFIS